LSRAARNHWPISEEVRQAAVEQLALIMSCHPDARTRIQAIKAMSLLDNLNAKRERTESERQSADLLTATRALRATLQSPEARAALAKASETMCVAGPTDGGPERP